MSEEKKSLLWTEHINKVLKQKAWWSKYERMQYRTDAIALKCRDIPKSDITTIQNGLYTEQCFFWLSRLYVPFALFRMYRRGVFTDSLTTSELKSVLKIAVSMHVIDLFGHFLFRLQTAQTVDKHIGVNEEEFALKKKQTMDDYLVQKNYLKNKKEGRS